MSTKINVNNAERLSSVLLGSALVSFGVVRRSGPLSLASIAGGAPLLWRGLTGNCPVYNALDINSASPEEINAKINAQPAGVPAGKGIKVAQQVTINKPPAEVFRFWSNFENLPRFMDHLESVKMHQNGCSHWVAKAPRSSGTPRSSTPRSTSLSPGAPSPAPACPTRARCASSPPPPARAPRSR